VWDCHDFAVDRNSNQEWQFQLVIKLLHEGIMATWNALLEKVQEVYLSL
jgi:hypothetical protein